MASRHHHRRVQHPPPPPPVAPFSIENILYKNDTATNFPCLPSPIPAEPASSFCSSHHMMKLWHSVALPKFPVLTLRNDIHGNPHEKIYENCGQNSVESISMGTPKRTTAPGHPYSRRAPAAQKKPRTSFTKTQISVLERRFVEQKYLASSERAPLAAQLQMQDAQVKTWFQNRRTKWRRQEAEEREFANKLGNALARNHKNMLELN